MSTGNSLPDALRVLADNPAVIDYLGLEVVAQAVTDVVCADNSEPITVGLHGPWGSGKSSLLSQVRANLKLADKTIVVEVNPWEFGAQEDVKGTIIATVLDKLIQKAGSSKTKKLKDLVERISWTRAAAAVASGALTMSWSLKELALALTPRPADGPPTTLAGFRDDFAAALNEIEQHRVVLLIDDLDRCLPSATLATLEAVKLFLAVPKMAFVVAADQTMVREAIAVGLGETRRGEAFARDYLDKIVQVPVTLPQPTLHDAECYVAILLEERSRIGVQIDALVQHADLRRSDGKTPYLLGVETQLLAAEHLEQAKNIVHGLANDDLVNPRRMKRFINSLAVRQHTAAASGVVVESAIVAKLFMLEHRFPTHLRELAELARPQRQALLAGWEAWALDAEEGAVAPTDESDDLKRVLSATPLLAAEDTEQYFVLARKLLHSRFSEGLGEIAAVCLDLLLHDNTAKQRHGVDQFTGLDIESQRTIVGELVTQTGTITNPANQIRAMLNVVDVAPDQEAIAAAIRGRKETLSAGAGFAMSSSKSPAIVELSADMQVDDAVPKLAKRAIRGDS